MYVEIWAILVVFIQKSTKGERLSRKYFDVLSWIFCISDCGSLQSPLNGNVEQASGTTYGQTATFSCSVGYEIFGADQTTCMADGKWSNVVPLCQITGIHVTLWPNWYFTTNIVTYLANELKENPNKGLLEIAEKYTSSLKQEIQNLMLWQTEVHYEN